ncbi:hypothetical protein [Pontiella sp.]|uniref:hypothetical protein n=1 Tax=Pontiella sp. TaxID=2837462 RepID=UPI0035615A68
MNRRYLPALLPVIGISLLTGCASSFQSGSLEPVSGYPEVFRKKTVFVDLAYAGKLNGEPWTKHDKRNQAYLEERLIREIEDSGMFSLVSDGLKTTDIQIYAAVINDKEKSSSNMTRSALTLFLYPNTETDHFRLMANVVDRTTGRKETIRLEHRVVRRQQLLLGLLAPFKSHAAELEDCTDRLMENLVLEIHKAGLLE